MNAAAEPAVQVGFLGGENLIFWISLTMCPSDVR